MKQLLVKKMRSLRKWRIQSVSHAVSQSLVNVFALTSAQSIANTKQMSVVPGEEFQDKNTSGPSSRLFCKDSEHVLLPAAGLESDASRLRTGTKQFPTWDSQVSEVVFGSELLNPGLPTVEFVGRFKGSAGQGSWERPCEEARMCPADSSRRLGLRRFPAARRRSESMEVFTHSTEEARMVTTVSPLRSDGLEPDFKKMFKDRAGKPSWVTSGDKLHLVAGGAPGPPIGTCAIQVEIEGSYPILFNRNVEQRFHTQSHGVSSSQELEIRAMPSNGASPKDAQSHLKSDAAAATVLVQCLLGQGAALEGWKPSKAVTDAIALLAQEARKQLPDVALGLWPGASEAEAFDEMRESKGASPAKVSDVGATNRLETP
eukprot:symbB.v1.2.022813.t1/scaffold2029.1/size91969/1